MNCQCHTDNRTWMCVEGKGPLEWRMFTLLSTLNRSSYKVHNVLLENLLDISNGYNHLPCQGIFTQSSVCSHLCVCVCVCVREREKEREREMWDLYIYVLAFYI